ncbi:serologically defined colon cancer antigen 8 homolog [Epargyreus clarus]|uniref:serologically defined colon cancer antigen 8 homolog n=1 Tax=Epargyreus clarus TaxID=520877 RepID=UPI003C2B264C
MGSTSFLTKPKAAGYRAKSGSSAGSDKEMNGKFRRTKIRRPIKMNDYGMKKIPDYTELAYKEAVSKLRYFLSGNTAPSVRSYGGSASIKNLDESDGDLDKKYSSSYNTLSEFKPKPRLTAKYATLYADSLNNYTPPNVNTNVPPPTTSPNDLTGGTNPDVINFIQKQEEYIEQLERESQYCRDELNNLLGKVKEVISENEHLHEAQKNKLISRMFHAHSGGSETDELDDLADSTGLDSDNKVTPSKARRAPRSRSTRLEGPNIVFESRIAELEAQLTQAKIDLKKVQDENNENKRKLASGLVDSTCLDGFKRQIDNLQRDKTTLESQITKLKLSLDQKEGDLDGRYKRGSDVVEHQLREERNNLETEVRRLKDELAKERSKVREMAGEGARRALQERSAAEQRYTAHCDELQHDLAAQYDNVAKLQLDLERQRREENDLKRELSMKNSAIEELKMELKNKTSSLQADLAQAHAEKASLEEELASARLAIERQQRQAKHETNRLNSEIQSLRQRLDRADADLVHSRRENLRLSEQISNLEKEINMKTLTPISPQKNKKEKELSSMLESMENKHAKTVAELEAMIHSQNSLMEKLTGECRSLTDKLDDANRRHKEELATLRRQVEDLGRSLQPTYAPPSTYQAPTTHPTTTNRMPHSSPGTRPDDTGAESPGDPSPGHQLRDVRRDSVNHKTPISRQNSQNSPPRRLSKQNSQNFQEETSTVTAQEPIDYTEEPTVSNIQYDSPREEYVPENENVENVEEHVLETADVDNKVEYKEEIQQEENKAMEVEQEQTLDQQYPEGYQNYEQTYEETQPTETEYQNEGYEQNFEQQQYTEGQYENYEQYPQQYTEPTAQYEGQYENYQAEGYQNESYDNTQYEHQYAPEYTESVPTEVPPTTETLNTESKDDSPEKLPSQS